MFCDFTFVGGNHRIVILFGCFFGKKFLDVYIVSISPMKGVLMNPHIFVFMFCVVKAHISFELRDEVDCSGRTSICSATQFIITLP